MRSNPLSFLNRVKILFSRKRLAEIIDQSHQDGYKECEYELTKEYYNKVSDFQRLYQNLARQADLSVLTPPNSEYNEIVLIDNMPFDWAPNRSFIDKRYKLSNRTLQYLKDPHVNLLRAYDSAAHDLAKVLLEENLVQFTIYHTPNLDPDIQCIKASVKFYKPK